MPHAQTQGFVPSKAAFYVHIAETSAQTEIQTNQSGNLVFQYLLFQ